MQTDDWQPVGPGWRKKLPKEEPLPRKLDLGEKPKVDRNSPFWAFFITYLLWPFLLVCKAIEAEQHQANERTNQRKWEKECPTRRMYPEERGWK